MTREQPFSNHLGASACAKMPQLVILGLSQNPKQQVKSFWLKDHQDEQVFSHSLPGSR